MLLVHDLRMCPLHTGGLHASVRFVCRRKGGFPLSDVLIPPRLTCAACTSTRSAHGSMPCRLRRSRCCDRWLQPWGLG